MSEFKSGTSEILLHSCFISWIGRRHDDKGQEALVEEKHKPAKSQMSPRRIKAMASTDDRKEQQENNDTPEDQAPVSRQRKPSVDSTEGPQVPPQNIPPMDLSERRASTLFSPQRSWVSQLSH